MAKRTQTIKALPASDRPRERLLERGVGALSDTEILAVLLGTGNHRTAETAIDLAHRLLRHLQDQRLYGLVDITAEELRGLSGIGAVKACRLLAAVELGRRVRRERLARPLIGRPEDAAAVLIEDMQHLDREHFKAILLDTKHRVITIESVSMGSLNAAVAHPREVFKAGIKRSAAALILAHNHPSGDPTPSQDDLEVTRRILRAGRLLGIEVLDHLVIGENCYSSIRQRGMDWADEEHI